VFGKPLSSIRLAIKSCLVRCSQSSTPLACLADFAGALSCHGWDAESVREVERGVFAILTGDEADPWREQAVAARRMNGQRGPFAAR